MSQPRIYVEASDPSPATAAEDVCKGHGVIKDPGKHTQEPDNPKSVGTDGVVKSSAEVNKANTVRALSGPGRISNRATGAAWFDRVGSGEYGVVYKVSPEYAAAHELEVDFPLVCKVIEHYNLNSVAVMHDSAILEILCSKYLHETGFPSPGTIQYLRVEIGWRETTLYMREYKHALDAYMDEFELPPPTIKRIMYRLLQGVHSLHRMGIVHRDLKPGNVFMDDGDTVVVGDFGFSVFVKNINLASPSNAIIQTAHYRAPEIFLDKEHYGLETDMWSVGCIMFELLTERRFLHGHDKGADGHMKRLFAIMGVPASDAFTRLPGYAKLQSFGLDSVGEGIGVQSDDEQAQSLLESLLTLDPARRITAVQALNHPYFAEYNPPCTAPIEEKAMLLHFVPAFSMPTYGTKPRSIVFDDRRRHTILKLLKDEVTHFGLSAENYFFCCDLADLFFAADTVTWSEVRLFVFVCIYFAVAMCDNAALLPDADFEEQLVPKPTALVEMQMKVLKALHCNLGFTSLLSLIRSMAAEQKVANWRPMFKTLRKKVVSRFKLRFYPPEAVAVAFMDREVQKVDKHHKVQRDVQHNQHAVLGQEPRNDVKQNLQTAWCPNVQQAVLAEISDIIES